MHYTSGIHEHFATLADVERIERVAFETRCPYKSVPEMITARAGELAEAPALIWLRTGRASDGAEQISYGQLGSSVRRMANLLHTLGVRRGQGVSILMPNMPEMVSAMWGASAASHANPINPLLSVAQITDIADAAGSTVLVTAGPSAPYEVYEKAQAVRARLPRIRHVIVVDGAAQGDIDYRTALDGAPDGRPLRAEPISLDDVSVCFHTGGTTGTPKLAQQTHRNQLFTAWTCAFLFALSRTDRILTGLPLFHANAAIATGLSAVFAGASTLLCGPTGYRDKAMVKDFQAIVERWRVTMFSAVPTVYAALLDNLAAGDLSSLRFGFCGAAPMPPSLFDDFEKRTGVRIIEGYGMTEGGALSACNPRDGERRIGSIGLRLPYQTCKPALVDDDGAFVRDCAAGEVGTLLLAGPNIFPGYRERRHNTGIWPAPSHFQSGDLARSDADGYLWMAGRAKDLIIRGGHNIDPAAIEEALQRHPAVEVAAAVGKPDAYAGEVPIAYVRLAKGARVDPDALRSFAAENVSEPPAAPVEVFIVDHIPVTAVGKIFKPALRLDATQRALTDALIRVGIQAEVTARLDERAGIIAEIRLQRGAPIEVVRDALGRFAVSHLIIPEDPAA